MIVHMCIYAVHLRSVTQLENLYVDLTVVACRLSKVFCAVERKDSGIPANFAAFCMRQRHPHRLVETYDSMRIGVDPRPEFILIAESAVLNISPWSWNRCDRRTPSLTSVQ